MNVTEEKVLVKQDCLVIAPDILMQLSELCSIEKLTNYLHCELSDSIWV